MKRMEFRQRKRALVVIAVVFALLIRMFFFAGTETKAATPVDGVSLTVEYYTDGNTPLITQTYYRYYTDEASGAMEDSVTIQMPAESEVSLASGNLFMAWELTEPIGQEYLYLAPLEEYTFDWASLLDGQPTSAIKLSVYGNIREYSVSDRFTSEDYMTYKVTNYDSIGDISVTRVEGGLKISAPGTPELESHEFSHWQILNSDYMPVATAKANEVFVSPDGGDFLLDYYSYESMTIEPVGIPVACINFYPNEYDMTTVLNTVYVTKETDDNGTKALAVQMADAPADGPDSLFLTWFEQINYTYVQPGTTVVYDLDDTQDGYSEWPALSSGYEATVFGTWVDIAMEFGDVEVTGYESMAGVERQEDYFTLTAPGNAMADGYYLKEWKVTLGGTDYQVTPGETVCDSRGTPLQLEYKTYAGETITFVAEWEPLLTVTVEYYASRSDYTQGIVAWSDIHTQEGGTDSVTIRMPSAGNTDRTFLRWTCVQQNGHFFEDKQIEFYWEYLGSVNYTLQMVAETVDVIVDMNDNGDADAIGESEFEIVRSDTYFEVVVPERIPGRTGYTFGGWSAQTDIGERETLSPGGTWSLDYDGHEEAYVTFTANWVANPTPTPTPIPDPVMVYEGDNYLWDGEKYQFSGGTWMIEGDATVYEGWIEFYVPSYGYYYIKGGE